MNQSSPIPRLNTARLLLREYQMRDFDAFATYLARLEPAGFGGAAGRHSAWGIFGCHAGGWLLNGAGWWAMELCATEQVVGVVGAFYREGCAVLQLGCNMYEEFLGRGFASEAAAAVLRYAFDVRGEQTAEALIAPRNRASVKMAERVGLMYTGDTEVLGELVGRYVGFK